MISDDHGASWRAIGPNLPYEPSGLTYSAPRQAFYIWRFSCDLSLDSNPVLAEAVMRLDTDLQSL